MTVGIRITAEDYRLQNQDRLERMYRGRAKRHLPPTKEQALRDGAGPGMYLAGLNPRQSEGASTWFVPVAATSAEEAGAKASAQYVVCKHCGEKDSYACGGDPDAQCEFEWSSVHQVVEFDDLPDGYVVSEDRRGYTPTFRDDGAVLHAVLAVLVEDEKKKIMDQWWSMAAERRRDFIAGVRNRAGLSSPEEMQYNKDAPAAVFDAADQAYNRSAEGGSLVSLAAQLCELRWQADYFNSLLK